MADFNYGPQGTSHKISEPINFENCIKTNIDQHSGENENVPVNQIDAPAQENQENGEIVPVVEENAQINNAPPPPVAVNGAVNAGELQATQFDRVMGMFESTMRMMQTQMMQSNEMMKAQMYSQNKLFETLSNTTSQLNSTSSSSNGGAHSKSKPTRPRQNGLYFWMRGLDTNNDQGWTTLCM